MSRIPNETYPALREKRFLTYLPCIERKSGKHAGMMTLSNGYLFLVVSGFDSPFASYDKALSFMEQTLLSMEPEGKEAVYNHLAPWHPDVPALAEDMADTWGFDLTGLPVEVPLSNELVYNVLLNDATLGRVKLILPPMAAAVLGCSRQNIHTRFQCKSLTPLRAQDLYSHSETQVRHTTYCLMSEIEAEAKKKQAKKESHVSSRP